jgi:flagellar hook-associated protein 1 FlgK
MGDMNGLRTALSALQAQRRALEVHGHNIANVGTEGYSRQRLGLVSASASAIPAIFSQSDGIGQGVKVGEVQRLRDAFLESRGHHEHAIGAALNRLSTSFDRVELAFAEPGENGIAAQMADFLAGWDDVANRPEDLAARTSIIERGRTLAASFGQTDLGLESLAATSVEQLRHLSSEVNALASRVAELNGRIQVATRAGIAPNDLLDERDRVVGQLGQKVGATMRASDDGMVDVFIGGTAVVRGVRAEGIEVSIDAGVTSLVWSKDGLTAQVGGDASGLLATTNDIVPRYRAQLAEVATQLADEVNALHRTGFGLDGATGDDFFVIGATGLTVSAAIAADPRRVAASGVGPPAEPTVATRDNTIARAIAKITGPDATYRELVVSLGVEAQTAKRRSEIQATITAQVDAARQSESGVDLDQELAEMLGVQHAYNAAARLMSAVDEALDTLVNRTGLVGR